MSKDNTPKTNALRSSSRNLRGDLRIGTPPKSMADNSKGPSMSAKEITE